jgi:ABC-type glutathione transport system ATPase component
MRSIGWMLGGAIKTHDPKAKRVEAQVTSLLNDVGLPAAYAKRRPVALSGGERQRVAIARALAVKPRILICDEPVSALDMSMQAQILKLFSKLRAERGPAYLFITHDLSIVRQVTEHLYVMPRAHRRVGADRGRSHAAEGRLHHEAARVGLATDATAAGLPIGDACKEGVALRATCGPPLRLLRDCLPIRRA